MDEQNDDKQAASQPSLSSSSSSVEVVAEMSSPDQPQPLTDYVQEKMAALHMKTG